MSATAPRRLLSRAGWWLVSLCMRESFRYELAGSGMLPEEWVLALVVLGIGLAASALPAIRALRIDPSKTLSEG